MLLCQCVEAIHELPLQCAKIASLLEFFKKLKCYLNLLLPEYGVSYVTKYLVVY